MLVLVLHGHSAAVHRVAFSVMAARSPQRPRMARRGSGTRPRWTTPACSAATRATSIRSPIARTGAGSPRGRGIGPSACWDAASGSPVQTLRGHTQAVGALAFTPDGTRLASWAEDSTIRVWDTATGAESQPATKHLSMYQRDSVYSLVVSPDGKRLGAVAGRDSGEQGDLPAKGRVDCALGPRRPARSCHRSTSRSMRVRVAAFSPDGRRLAAGGDDPKVVIVDAVSGELLAELTGFTGRIQSIAFSPDGRQVLTAGMDPTLRLWDASTGRLAANLRRPWPGGALGGLPSRRHPDRFRWPRPEVLIWDTATGEELVRLPGHASYVFSLAFSPDGETLVSGSGDSTVRLWDAFPVARRLQARCAARASR